MQAIENKVKDYLYFLAYDINYATYKDKDILQSVIDKKMVRIRSNEIN